MVSPRYVFVLIVVLLHKIRNFQFEKNIDQGERTAGKVPA